MRTIPNIAGLHVTAINNVYSHHEHHSLPYSYRVTFFKATCKYFQIHMNILLDNVVIITCLYEVNQ